MSAFTPIAASEWAPTGAPGSLQHLCSVSKRACDLFTPMVRPLSCVLRAVSCALCPVPCVLCPLSNFNSLPPTLNPPGPALQLVEFYTALNSSTSKLKGDDSVFTIADGTVQHLLIEHLYAGR